MNKESENHLNLEKLTKVILIIGIISVSGGIFYFLFRPQEEFVVFSLLNEEKKLGNYPQNATINENISLYIFLDNQFQDNTEFLIKIYKGDNQTIINTTTGVKNANYFNNITVNIPSLTNWTSKEISTSFSQKGSNQTIIFELFKKDEGSWIFIPNHILFIRLDILNL